MPSGILKMAVKKIDWDLNKFNREMTKNRRRRLARFGAFVRRTAMQSIKTAKVKVSSPGEPPRNKTGKLKKLILYDVEQPAFKNVVIGPKKFASAVADVIEYGGTERLRVGPKNKKRTVQIKYAERPFMVPAFQKNLKEHLSLIEDLI